MTEIRLTEADVANCTWTYVGEDEHYRTYVGHGTHPKTGQEITVRKREPKFEESLISLNKAERDSRDEKRWSAGSGSDRGGNMPMVRVGRIPLNKFLGEMSEKMREGDKDHLKWWLNRDENQPFRTKSGKL